MGDPNEKFSRQANRYPADLLKRFMGGISKRSELEEEKEEEEDDDEGDVELNLGLSLGGRFGVDKNKLVRSSSIAGLPIVRGDDVAPPPPVVYQSLMRSSSLPAEMDEWRKRKELQCFRRMEAKRRRTEKQKNKDGGGGGGGGGGEEEERRDIEGNLRGKVEREQYLAATNRCGSGVAVPVRFSTWDASARQAFIGGGIDVSMGKGKGIGGGGGNMQGLGKQLLQGSIETQWRSSSSVSEMDSKPLQGSSSCVDGSPASIRSIQEQRNQEAVGSSGLKTREHEAESASKRTAVTRNKGKEIGMNAIEDMPCVFTKGDGPNGRRIEGILYKYGKGEEVRIMCVCHGSFLTPAEFVKHAGGSDVTHPLKHIVVSPNSSFSL